MPDPTQISLDPVVIAQSVVIAAGVVLLVPFPSALFNSTLEENYQAMLGGTAAHQRVESRRIPGLVLVWIRRQIAARRTSSSPAADADATPLAAQPVVAIPPAGARNTACHRRRRLRNRRDADVGPALDGPRRRPPSRPADREAELAVTSGVTRRWRTLSFVLLSGAALRLSRSDLWYDMRSLATYAGLVIGLVGRPPRLWRAVFVYFARRTCR